MVTQTPPAITALSWRARRPWVRRRLHAALVASGRTWHTLPEVARAASLADLPPGEAQAAITELVQAGAVEGIRGPHGWSRVRGLTIVVAEQAARTAITPSPERTRRSFSVVNRVRRHRSSGLGSGALLFGVAAVVAAAVALWLMRSWNGSPATRPAPLTRDGWYQQVARGYLDGYRAGRPGFTLPYRFTELSGVTPDAPPAQLEQGFAQYLKAALFLGYPSHGGLLAWARTEFGELPGGDQADAWFRRVAEAYAARSLAGTPGYEISSTLSTAGGIAAGERDAAALTAGLVRALRTAVYLGTPEPGGVLDWARRTYGDLPAP